MIKAQAQGGATAQQAMHPSRAEILLTAADNPDTCPAMDEKMFCGSLPRDWPVKKYFLACLNLKIRLEGVRVFRIQLINLPLFPSNFLEKSRGNELNRSEEEHKEKEADPR